MHGYWVELEWLLNWTDTKGEGEIKRTKKVVGSDDDKVIWYFHRSVRLKAIFKTFYKAFHQNDNWGSWVMGCVSENQQDPIWRATDNFLYLQSFVFLTLLVSLPQHQRQWYQCLIFIKSHLSFSEKKFDEEDELSKSGKNGKDRKMILWGATSATNFSNDDLVMIIIFIKK